MSRFEVEDVMLRLLDGLDDKQRAQLDRLIAADDPEALAALAEARDALASLALGLEPVAPPAAVGERLMRRVRAAERGQALAAGAAPRAGPSLWKPLLGSAIAAGIVVVLGATVTQSLLRAPLERERDALALEQNRLLGERADLESELASLETRIEQLSAELRSAEVQVGFLRAPDLVIERLAPLDAGAEASARIFWDRNDYRCYLHAQGLEPPEDGRALYLWVFADDGRVLRVGRVEPNFAGEAVLFVEMPDDMKGIVRAVITDEPDTPGDAPSGVPQLAWDAESA